MVQKQLRWAIALLYLIFISVLFFLPGSALPQSSWLDRIWFDKWVHIGLFAALIFLWRWAFFPHRIAILILGAAAYGISVEVIQDQFVSNRSFDMGDWAADMIGVAVGMWFWKLVQKNRPL